MKKLLISVLMAFGIVTPINASGYLKQLQPIEDYSHQPTIKKTTNSTEEMASMEAIDMYLSFIDINIEYLSNTCKKSQASASKKQLCQIAPQEFSKLYNDFSKDNLAQKEFILLENKYNRLENKLFEVMEQSIWPQFVN